MSLKPDKCFLIVNSEGNRASPTGDETLHIDLERAQAMAESLAVRHAGHTYYVAEIVAAVQKPLPPPVYEWWNK
jgi:hypothetical protein